MGYRSAGPAARHSLVSVPCSGWLRYPARLPCAQYPFGRRQLLLLRLSQAVEAVFHVQGLAALSNAATARGQPSRFVASRGCRISLPVETAGTVGDKVCSVRDRLEGAEPFPSGG